MLPPAEYVLSTPANLIVEPLPTAKSPFMTLPLASTSIGFLLDLALIFKPPASSSFMYGHFALDSDFSPNSSIKTCLANSTNSLASSFLTIRSLLYLPSASYLVSGLDNHGHIAAPLGLVNLAF